MRRALLFLLIFFSISFVAASQTEIHTAIEIEVLSDGTYDTFMTYSFDFDYWGTKGWSFTLGSDLENLHFSDDSGDIRIKSSEVEDAWTRHTVDFNYKGGGGFKNVYINTSGNSLNDVNGLLKTFSFLAGSFEQSSADETLQLTLKLPENYLFLSTAELSNNDLLDNREFALNYSLVPSFYDFLLIEKEDLVNFEEKTIDNKKILIEKDERLLGIIDKVFESKDLIVDYPLGKRDLIVFSVVDNASVLSNTVDVWALCYPNNYILLDRSLVDFGSEEEMISVLLHELTHYAESYHSDYFLFPGWLTESIAVYTEIKYIERNFPEFGGHIPTNLDFYNRKPTEELLMRWYDSEDFISAEYNYTFNGAELYSLFGFPANNLVLNKGEAALLELLRDSRSNIQKLNWPYISEAGLESVIFDSYSDIFGVQRGNVKEEFLFPNRILLDFSEDEFLDSMEERTIGVLSAEKLVEFNNYGTSPLEDSESYILWIIGGIIILMIIAGTILIKVMKRGN
jgi:hypothetical protein